MRFIPVQKRPENVVNLFATSQGAATPMPETSRRPALGQPAAPPTKANVAEIELDPKLIRGLHRWTGATLSDGRVLLELELDVPGGAPESVQVVLHRPVLDELGQDARRLAAMLHLDLR